MTISSSSPTNPPPSDRGRRNRARPGVSLMAQGEVWVWLTGGALLLALLMIAGLIGYIFWEGSRTFWPAPVAQVKLHDGQVLLGEVLRREDFEFDESMIERLDSGEQELARQSLAGASRRSANRMLLHIGNFEFTHQHHRWISDYSLADDSPITYPADAVLVERLEWGRFFGEVDALVERFPRPAVAGLMGNLEVTRLIEEQLGELPTEEQSLAQEALQLLQGEANAFKDVSLTRLRDYSRAAGSHTGVNAERFPSFASATWLALLADGTTKPLAEVTSGEDVVEAQAWWRDADKIWSTYEAAHAEARNAWRERRALERHELGRVNQQLEEARLIVRQAELSGELEIISSLEQSVTLERELDELQRSRTEMLSFVEKVRGRMSEREVIRRVTDQALALWQSKIASREESIKQELAPIQEQLGRLPATARKAIDNYRQVGQAAELNANRIRKAIAELSNREKQFEIQFRSADSQVTTLPLAQIVRAFRPNQFSTTDRWWLYGARWWEFLSDEPREANSEGGIWPAIVGTICMTLLMSLAVVPFGVLAALYLREYARSGWMVAAIRIAINNLAGVPSIVFGAFGFGFFCYSVGGFLDGGPENPWPPYRWYIGLGVVVLVALIAFVLGMLTIAYGQGHPRAVWTARLSLATWLLTTLLFFGLISVTPFFHGFYAASLPNPTLGKGGLAWASLTLALLTLPVVIVATEEALSAVPNSLREGSYACGAGKYQTIRRIILPQAMPGILTGMILAMARGAGEVAPLMLVGAVKLAPELPVDFQVPFVHGSRSFMHLGFHIFDLGFQSQNSEAAKPMVFTTTMLLIGMIVLLNVAAIALRTRLRRRYRTSQF
ncbi:MAG: ABC transporter permease subunit [Planctomycetota bacterium]